MFPVLHIQYDSCEMSKWVWAYRNFLLMVCTASSSVTLRDSEWTGDPWSLWEGLTFFMNMNWSDYYIAISCPRGYLISSSLHLAQSVSQSPRLLLRDSLSASFHSSPLSVYLCATTLYFSAVCWMTCLNALAPFLLYVCGQKCTGFKYILLTMKHFLFIMKSKIWCSKTICYFLNSLN